MTFDEAIKEIDNALDLIDYDDMTNKIDEVFNKLREEYAPTIEMTAKEKEHLLSIATTSVTFTNFYEQVLKQSTNIKFGVQTTPELYKHLSENELMQAWLHPETIKVKGD